MTKFISEIFDKERDIADRAFENYYKAFKTVFAIDGEEAPIDEDHLLDIEVFQKYEDEIIELGWEEWDEEEYDDNSLPDRLDSDQDQYYVNAGEGTLTLSPLYLPVDCVFNVEDCEEKIHNLLGLKKEWIKFSAING